jgi:hypothetical protein
MQAYDFPDAWANIGTDYISTPEKCQFAESTL